MPLLSIVEYMHDLKEAGFTDKQSEVQARRLELVVANVQAELKQDIKQELQTDDLVHKKDLDLAVERMRADLQLELGKIRFETLKFTVWTGVAVVASMAGMLAKGFHWF